LKLTGERTGPSVALTVKGHEFVVPQGLRGVARASFNDLCAKPLGASDYLAMAEKFHTLILDDIPVMDIDKRNEAKRFILLIDELYDTQTKLIASAAAEPTELYKATSGREAFEFDRTASRLIEMRSHDYLALPHGRTHLGGSSAGLVET
jgi:cell division protein ZapE